MANKRPGWTPQHVFRQVRGRDRREEHPDWGREKPGVSYNELWMWASNQSCLMGFCRGTGSILPCITICVCSRWGAGQGAASALWPWNEPWESVENPTGRTEILLCFNLQAKEINMATIGAGIVRGVSGPAMLDVTQGVGAPWQKHQPAATSRHTDLWDSGTPAAKLLNIH